MPARVLTTLRGLHLQPSLLDEWGQDLKKLVEKIQRCADVLDASSELDEAMWRSMAAHARAIERRAAQEYRRLQAPNEYDLLLEEMDA